MQYAPHLKQITS